MYVWEKQNQVPNAFVNYSYLTLAQCTQRIIWILWQWEHKLHAKWKEIHIENAIQIMGFSRVFFGRLLVVRQRSVWMQISNEIRNQEMNSLTVRIKWDFVSANICKTQTIITHCCDSFNFFLSLLRSSAKHMALCFYSMVLPVAF